VMAMAMTVPERSLVVAMPDSDSFT